MTFERQRIYLPQRGFSRSLGNMVEVVLGSTLARPSARWWIEVEERRPNVHVVVDDNMTVKNGDWVVDNTSLGFSWWDDEVIIRDVDSELFEYFGISQHLRWRDVNLAPYRFRAPSFQRLREALSHVHLCAWCPGDM